MRKQKYACVLCGSNNYIVLFQSEDRMFSLPGRFQEVQCERCSMISLFPQPNKNSLFKYYPSQKYYSYASGSRQTFFSGLRSYLLSHYYNPNLFTKFLLLFIPNVPGIPYQVLRGKLMDIGCGSGQTLMYLKRLGWRVYGIDIDKDAISLAKRSGVDEAVVGTYEALKRFPDQYFDVIRMYHVIEHIDDPNKCMKLITQKIKPSGEIIIGTPNTESILSKIFKTYWYNLDAPRHLFLFSPRTLRQLFNKHGIQHVSTEFCSGGGILGSVQYWMAKTFNIKMDLIHNQWFVLLIYPLEWILDRLKKGDVFVMRGSLIR